MKFRAARWAKKKFSPRKQTQRDSSVNRRIALLDDELSRTPPYHVQRNDDDDDDDDDDSSCIDHDYPNEIEFIIPDLSSLQPIPPPYSPESCKSKEDDTNQGKHGGASYNRFDRRMCNECYYNKNDSPSNGISSNKIQSDASSKRVPTSRLEPLDGVSKDVEMEWSENWDPNYRCFYYFNDVTKKSQWERPDASFYPYGRGDGTEMLFGDEKDGGSVESFTVSSDVVNNISPPRLMVATSSPQRQNRDDTFGNETSSLVEARIALSNYNNPDETAYLSHRTTSSIVETVSLKNALNKIIQHGKSTKPIPNEFECSITMEIMHDPVIAADGHSYERCAMEFWLERNDTSPKTNERLDHEMLIPNHALRSMIRDFVLEVQADDGSAIDRGRVVAVDD